MRGGFSLDFFEFRGFISLDFFKFCIFAAQNEANKCTVTSVTDSEEEERKEVEAFLYASKNNMSPIIAQYL